MTATNAYIEGLQPFSQGQQNVIQGAKVVYLDITSEVTAQTIGLLILQTINVDDTTRPKVWETMSDEQVLRSITGMVITPAVDIAIGQRMVDGSVSMPKTITADTPYYAAAVEAWRNYIAGAGTVALELVVEA